MYKVGQVLFVISDSEMKVIPVQIVEQNVKITLSGEEVTYVVQTASKDKTFDLAKVKGQIYTSIEAAEKTLLDNAKNAINEIVKKAKNVSESAFGYVATPEKKKAEKISIDDLDSHLSEDTLDVITLPNGMKAKVSLGESVKNNIAS